MSIILSCDSACDLTQEQITNNKINILPFAIILGHKEYVENKDFDNQKIFDFVKKTGQLPKTAAYSVSAIEEYFRNLLVNEDDVVLHLSLSFEMTSAGNNAVLASQNIGNGRVRVIDSQSLSSGIALLLMLAVEEIEKGKKIDDIVALIEKSREKIRASFIVETLNFLYKGGRCNSLQLFGANLLKIKPRISVNNGIMTVTKKYRGKLDEAIKSYFVDLMAENKPNKKRVYIAHTCPEELVNAFSLTLKEWGFLEVNAVSASATIASHCGPNTFSIMFAEE